MLQRHDIVQLFTCSSPQFLLVCLGLLIKLKISTVNTYTADPISYACAYKYVVIIILALYDHRLNK